MSVIDEYFAKLDEANRAELERIRKIVNATVPEAEEVISYGMPAFRYKSRYLIGFYVYKNHLSLFPTSKPIESLKNKLDDYKLSKGTIQFTLDNIIPESIIRKLLLYQIENIDRSFI
jgi:uncharacterized protein YdhG (YjbR/CyaY superfamily)